MRRVVRSDSKINKFSVQKKNLTFLFDSCEAAPRFNGIFIVPRTRSDTLSSVTPPFSPKVGGCFLVFVYVWLLGMNNEGSRVALRKRGHLRGAHALQLPSQTAPHATWQPATERDGSVGSKLFFPPDVPARRLPLSLIQSPPPSSPRGVWISPLPQIAKLGERDAPTR